jgi:tetrahydromethanopterin S-methyltransferase subunit G
VTQTPPPGQPPYGPPNQYGAAPYGFAPPDHPQAVTVLILGIVSVAVCGFVAPFAWVMGNRVVREIDASNGQLGGRAQAQVGRIIGIVYTCIVGAALVIGVLVLVIALIGATTSST